jgi:hypothetical protein
MNDGDMLDYVKASAALMGLPLDAARAQRVAEHLQRTSALAALLEEAGLVVSDEPAEVYRLPRLQQPEQSQPPQPHAQLQQPALQPDQPRLPERNEPRGGASLPGA